MEAKHKQARRCCRLVIAATEPSYQSKVTANRGLDAWVIVDSPPEPPMSTTLALLTRLAWHPWRIRYEFFNWVNNIHAPLFHNF